LALVVARGGNIDDADGADEWAMSHCREKAEAEHLLLLLLNTQHAHSDSSEALAAQYRTHCERRPAYARRCCSKAPHKPRRGTCGGGRKRPTGAAGVHTSIYRMCVI
jgi:hypothetical protein